jgi:hypothetical protein
MAKMLSVIVMPRCCAGEWGMEIKDDVIVIVDALSTTPGSVAFGRTLVRRSGLGGPVPITRCTRWPCHLFTVYIKNASPL